MFAPLRNKNILLTRSAEQATETIDGLKNLGAKVIHIPTIEIDFESYKPELQNALANIEIYTHLIFTSANSVKAVYNCLVSDKQLPPKLKAKIIAVGDKTKKTCEQFGFKVDYVPNEFSSKGILELLADLISPEDNILLPISELATNELDDFFNSKGVEYRKVNAYSVTTPKSNEIEESIETLKKEKIELAIFTSPSTFDNFVKMAKIKNLIIYFENIVIAVIGNKTKTHIENLGLRVSICPKVFTMQGLIEAITDYYLVDKAANLN